ncbi:sensor histidine kinase [Haloactinospora alba]|uniref:sensor histidine kinase n=1 Tax=Haloactinospora alba TaxID=405555 RepID=UPI001150568D|nr:sensor histidine kinase [Haloactinospora alba]
MPDRTPSEGTPAGNPLSRLPAAAVDGMLAVAVGAVTTGTELLVAESSGVQPRLAGFAALLCAAASLAAAGRFPAVTALTVGAATPLYYVLGPVDNGTAWLAFVAGSLRLAADGHRRWAYTGVGLALGAFASAELVDAELGRSLAVLGWVLAVVAACEIVLGRRDYLREAQHRAAEAERGRDEEVRRRATEERMRVARELHDVVAHNISLVNVQANAATHQCDPQRTRAALETIRTASTETLREVRRTMGVLNRAGEETMPRTAAPSLDQLTDLADRFTAEGLPVAVETAGREVELPASVGLVAYRVVQEALTNALRHARARSVRVSVRYGPARLRVSVDDDGCGPEPGAVEGAGIRGMRERVTALGGSFSAAPRPAGGFRVVALLPSCGGAQGLCDGRGPSRAVRPVPRRHGRGG